MAHKGVIWSIYSAIWYRKNEYLSLNQLFVVFKGELKYLYVISVQ